MGDTDTPKVHEGIHALRLRNEPVCVDPSDPFANDLLSRREHARVLTSLVGFVDGPAVISVESPWGTGKTTFIRMWSEQLKAKGFPLASFNAWETDYAGDPFIAMSSTVIEAVRSDHLGDVASSAVENAKTAAKVLATRALPGAARLLTAGLLNLPDDIEGEIAKTLGTAADDSLETFERASESVDAFKGRLQELAAEVAGMKDGHPLVVVVDELDRCRPTYAIELLERAKHLFSVRSVVFVLALDREQLVHSVKALYGQEFDASGYLRRFIDFDFRLPPPDPASFMRAQLRAADLERYLDRTRDPDARSGKELLEELLVALAPAMGLSLRQIERLVIRLAVVLVGLPGQKRSFMRATTIALLLRTWRPDLYRDFVGGRCPPDAIVEALESQVKVSADLTDHQWRLIEATILKAGLELDYDSERASEYGLQSHDETLDEDKRYHAQRIHELMRLGAGRGGIGFRHVVERIELVSTSLFSEK